MALESSVQLALIVAIPAIVSPLLLAWINDRTQRKAKLLEAAIRRQEKLEDYARQDRVATALATNNRIVEQANRQTNTKLDVIHTLVNSNMTAALQSELDATKREMVMMIEVIDLKKASGKLPSEEALHAVELTQAKIAELQATLADRLKASDEVARIQGKGT